jgi:hypothetical protein
LWALGENFTQVQPMLGQKFNFNKFIVELGEFRIGAIIVLMVF